MKKTITLSMMLMFGIALTGTGCTAEQPPNFAFELYRTTAKEKPAGKPAGKPTGNVVVSPYCAELLLDFVRSGAAGETKAEIDKVLGRTGVQWESAVPPLTTAAALWTQKDYSILPAFQETAKEKFGASAEQADFVNNSADAIRRINGWCSEKTNGKITSLFDSLDATTRCVLAGAIHFAADWKVPFNKDLTMDADFTLLDGSKVKTKIMSRSETTNYGETDETLIVELPYKDEGYAMLLLLPKDSAQFADWEAKLTAETLKMLREGMKPVQVDLRMPKFTVESDLGLNETLKQLGMATAFGQDADFSGISGQKDLYLSEVRQKTFVKVDETGTEAAAVTGAVIAVKMAIATKPFYANRPFLYLILKDSEILFFGRFAQPETPAPPVDPGLDGDGGTFS